MYSGSLSRLKITRVLRLHDGQKLKFFYQILLLIDAQALTYTQVFDLVYKPHGAPHDNQTRLSQKI